MSAGNGNGAAQEIGIYVMPTEEEMPPRAVFITPSKQVVGGAVYLDDAWRYPDGTEVPEELAEAITDHAESLGVEWDH